MPKPPACVQTHYFSVHVENFWKPPFYQARSRDHGIDLLSSLLTQFQKFRFGAVVLVLNELFTLIDARFQLSPGLYDGIIATGAVSALSVPSGFTGGEPLWMPFLLDALPRHRIKQEMLGRD